MKPERWWSIILMMGLFMALSPLSAQAGPNRGSAAQPNRQAFTSSQPRAFAPQPNRQAFTPSQPRNFANGWNGQPHQGQQPPGNTYGWNGQNRPAGNAYQNHPLGNAYGQNNHQGQWGQRNAYGQNNHQGQWGQHRNVGWNDHRRDWDQRRQWDRRNDYGRNDHRRDGDHGNAYGRNDQQRQWDNRNASGQNDRRVSGTTAMPPGGMITSISGNSRPMGVSKITPVLIIVPPIRYRLNPPIVPPGRRAIPIIPPSLEVKLALSPVFTAPMLPGIPLCLKANLLQG